VLGALALAVPAWAALPNYTLQLQARANMSGSDAGAYNVAPGNLIEGRNQVPITSDRQVAFRLTVTPDGDGRAALWWGKEGQGSRIYLLPDFGLDARMGDPGLNSAGEISFTVTGALESTSNGIYLLNASTPSQVRTLREPPNFSNWQSLELNEAGQLGVRALSTGRGAYVLLSPNGTGFQVTYLARERSLDAMSPYRLLGPPTLNDLGQMAGVADLVAQSPPPSEYSQQLRVFKADGTSTLIAQTRGLSPASPIFRFVSERPALNNEGQLAFVALAKDAAGKELTTIWLWNGVELKVVAQSGQGEIREVERLPPDLNDSGLVVFRAIDTAGLRAVWVGDGQRLKRVVGEHEFVPSDLGTARVDEAQPTAPVFTGVPRINARGDVTIVAGLAPPDDDQEEWGTGVYIAQAFFPPPPMDGGTDAGMEEPDAGPMPDAGPEEPPDAGGEPSPPTDSGGGCGCQATPAVALWPWVLLALARYLSGGGATGPSRAAPSSAGVPPPAARAGTAPPPAPPASSGRRRTR
jgi:uncharacterized protein (TIGR03382 family)